MILALSLGFGLGVLATVLAGEYERRKTLRRRPIAIVLGSPFNEATPRQRAEAARRLLSTLPGDK